jgi:hypothetical protein
MQMHISMSHHPPSSKITLHISHLHFSHLIPTSRLLTSLQLLHVPTTNTHVALILIHTISKALDVRGTWTGRFGGGVGLRVEGIIHGVAGSCVGVGGLLVFLLFGWGGRGAAAAAEKAADGVADGRTDCDAAVMVVVMLACVCFGEKGLSSIGSASGSERLTQRY